MCIFVNTLLVPNNFRNDLRPPSLRVTPIQSKGFLDLLNVRYLVAPSKEKLKTLLLNFDKLAAYQSPVYSDEVSVYERKTAFERVFIVHRASFQQDEEASLRLLKKIRNHLYKIIIINGEPQPRIQAILQRTPALDSSSAQILSYTANEVIISANMENPGFLVLSDNFHPDWQAFVNGKRSKIFRTDYLIRSVFLPEGTHEVRFIFKPASFYWGIYASLISLLIGLYFWNKKTDRKLRSGENKNAP